MSFDWHFWKQPWFWDGMRQYLTENGIDPGQIPIVIQFNKRDLPDVRTDQELAEIRQRGAEPVFAAVAIRGEGVLETLLGLLELVLNDLNRRYDFERKFNLAARDVIDGLFGRIQSPDPGIGAGS